MKHSASVNQPSLPTASPGKQEPRLQTFGIFLGSMDKQRGHRFWKSATQDSSFSPATMSLNLMCMTGNSEVLE